MRLEVSYAAEMIAVPEVVTKTIGVSDLVVWSITDVEHEVGVEVCERRRAVLYLRC